MTICEHELVISGDPEPSGNCEVPEQPSQEQVRQTHVKFMSKLHIIPRLRVMLCSPRTWRVMLARLTSQVKSRWGSDRIANSCTNKKQQEDLILHLSESEGEETEIATILATLGLPEDVQKEILEEQGRPVTPATPAPPTTPFGQVKHFKISFSSQLV